MASGTASLAWQSINGPNVWWNIATQGPTPPASIAIAHGSTVNFGVSVTGNWVNTSLTGTFTAGSYTITGTTTSGQCCIGQQLLGVGIGTAVQYLAPGPIFINALTSSTITFSSGNVPSVGFPALASGTSVPFIVASQWPVGSLAVSVSPSTGITIKDQNFDGTTNPSNMGAGTAICNLLAEGEGDFQVTFASTGTFVVSVTYEQADLAYANTTISDPLTFVVS